jgi:hypothetical protein
MTLAAETSFEERLGSDWRWALGESSSFFEGKGAVQETLARLVQRLNEIGVPYAVVGGMALFAHGYRRFTEDIDVLVRPADLEKIRSQMEGLGYVPLFPGSRNLRDSTSRVRVEFLLAGGFPGDGKPKPVSFPDPAESSVTIGGVRFLRLHELVELKLASGMSAAHRLKDLADVMELIRLLGLRRELGDELDESVREKYVELWASAQSADGHE